MDLHWCVVAFYAGFFLNILRTKNGYYEPFLPIKLKPIKVIPTSLRKKNAGTALVKIAIL